MLSLTSTCQHGAFLHVRLVLINRVPDANGAVSLQLIMRLIAVDNASKWYRLILNVATPTEWPFDEKVRKWWVFHEQFN